MDPPPLPGQKCVNSENHFLDVLGQKALLKKKKFFVTEKVWSDT